MWAALIENLKTLSSVTCITRGRRERGYKRCHSESTFGKGSKRELALSRTGPMQGNSAQY
jgi:hypothetical protein